MVYDGPFLRARPSSPWGADGPRPVAAPAAPRESYGSRFSERYAKSEVFHDKGRRHYERGDSPNPLGAEPPRHASPPGLRPKSPAAALSPRDLLFGDGGGAAAQTSPRQSPRQSMRQSSPRPAPDLFAAEAGAGRRSPGRCAPPRHSLSEFSGRRSPGRYQSPRADPVSKSDVDGLFSDLFADDRRSPGRSSPRALEIRSSANCIFNGTGERSISPPPVHQNAGRHASPVHGSHFGPGAGCALSAAHDFRSERDFATPSKMRGPRPAATHESPARVAALSPDGGGYAGMVAGGPGRQSSMADLLRTRALQDDGQRPGVGFTNVLPGWSGKSASKVRNSSPGASAALAIDASGQADSEVQCKSKPRHSEVRTSSPGIRDAMLDCTSHSSKADDHEHLDQEFRNAGIQRKCRHSPRGNSSSHLRSSPSLVASLAPVRTSSPGVRDAMLDCTSQSSKANDHDLLDQEFRSAGIQPKGRHSPRGSSSSHLRSSPSLVASLAPLRAEEFAPSAAFTRFAESLGSTVNFPPAGNLRDTKTFGPSAVSPGAAPWDEHAAIEKRGVLAWGSGPPAEAAGRPRRSSPTQGPPLLAACLPTQMGSPPPPASFEGVAREAESLRFRLPPPELRPQASGGDRAWSPRSSASASTAASHGDRRESTTTPARRGPQWKA